MKLLNVEIKARCRDVEHIRAILTRQGAEHRGRDHQIDTYYKVPQGRLKLRQGNIENALIAYTRENLGGPKRSDVQLFKTTDGKALKATLDAAMDVLIVVDKTRDIYFIDRVKFHLDDVKGLGSFIEIEAIDEAGKFTEEALRQDCQHYLRLFDIQDSDLMTHSYSDMLLAGYAG
jgi:predicted adenylyl cyclase CyaB